MRRLLVPVFASILCLTGLALAADALVTTDAERIDEIVDDVTAARLEDRVDGALSHVRPHEIPFRLTVDGRVHEFAGGDQVEGGAALRSALAVFDSDRQEVLQRSVDIEERHARIVTRVGDAEYEQTVIYELARTNDNSWTIRSIRTL